MKVWRLALANAVGAWEAQPQRWRQLGWLCLAALVPVLGTAALLGWCKAYVRGRCQGRLAWPPLSWRLLWTRYALQGAAAAALMTLVAAALYALWLALSLFYGTAFLLVASSITAQVASHGEPQAAVVLATVFDAIWSSISPAVGIVLSVVVTPLGIVTLTRLDLCRSTWAALGFEGLCAQVRWMSAWVLLAWCLGAPLAFGGWLLGPLGALVGVGCLVWLTELRFLSYVRALKQGLRPLGGWQVCAPGTMPKASQRPARR